MENVQASEPAPCAANRVGSARSPWQGGWRTNWQTLQGQRCAALCPIPVSGANTASGQKCGGCPAAGSVHPPGELPADSPLSAETLAASRAGRVGVGELRGAGRRERAVAVDPCTAKISRLPGSVSLATWHRQPNLASAAGQSWPTVRAIPLVRAEAQDPLTVWDRIIGMYRHFRQGEGFARNDGPGRSRYPEAETIRRITKRRMKKHEPRNDMPDGFPRGDSACRSSSISRTTTKVNLPPRHSIPTWMARHWSGWQALSFSSRWQSPETVPCP